MISIKNRELLQQILNDELPTAESFTKVSVRPRRSWRKVVAVAVAAVVAVGCIGVAGAEVYRNSLEQLEDSHGIAITDVISLQPGKLYTVESHIDTEDQSYGRASNVYHELPDGTVIGESQMLAAGLEGYSEDDESRLQCIFCGSGIYEVTEPEEFSFQRPSADEPETFNVSLMRCSGCGALSNAFDVDGKVLPHGLQLQLAELYPSIEVETPVIGDATLIDSVEDMEFGKTYGSLVYKGNVFFFENVPENDAAKYSSQPYEHFICPNCVENGKNVVFYNQLFYLKQRPEYSFTDPNYGDVYTWYDTVVACCAECDYEMFGVR